MTEVLCRAPERGGAMSVGEEREDGQGSACPYRDSPCGPPNARNWDQATSGLGEAGPCLLSVYMHGTCVFILYVWDVCIHVYLCMCAYMSLCVFL